MISKVVFEIKNSIRSWSDQEISFSSKNILKYFAKSVVINKKNTMPSAFADIQDGVHHPVHKNQCRNTETSDYRGCGILLSGNYRGQTHAEGGEVRRWLQWLSVPGQGRDAGGGHALAAPLQPCRAEVQRHLPGTAAKHHPSWSSYNKDKLENSSKYKGLH